MVSKKKKTICGNTIIINVGTMHTYILKILQQNCIVKGYINVCAVLFCIILVHFSWLVAPAEIAAAVAKQLFEIVAVVVILMPLDQALFV